MLQRRSYHENLNYQNIQLFNDLKTGTLRIYTSRIMKILEDKIEDLNDKVDDMDNQSKQDKADIDNNFQHVNTMVKDIENEVKDLQKLTKEINTSVNNLDQDIQNRIDGAIDDLQRNLIQKIQGLTVAIKNNEERSKNNEASIKELQTNFKGEVIDKKRNNKFN